MVWRPDSATSSTSLLSSSPTRLVLDIPCYTTTDLVAQRLLPPGWEAQISAAVNRFSTSAVLRGGTSTSLEVPGSDIPYRLMDGSAIREHLPWLDDLYRTHLVALATAAAGTPVVPSNSIKSGINLNVLDGPGGRYELHTDSNPLTGLLFVTSHQPDDGGQLMFTKDGQERTLTPRAGTFTTFDARTVPHKVTPLAIQTTRISAPMNFYLGEMSERPSDLDDYLYGGGEPPRTTPKED
jgi:hypothetical protein